MPSDAPSPIPAHGLTPREAGKRWRMSADRIRALIRSGQLGAIDTAPVRCGKPRFVILPQHVAQYEAKRQVVAESPPARRRKRRAIKDYYPD